MGKRDEEDRIILLERYLGVLQKMDHCAWQGEEADKLTKFMTGKARQCARELTGVTKH
jgi:hypothetical protein